MPFLAITNPIQNFSIPEIKIPGLQKFWWLLDFLLNSTGLFILTWGNSASHLGFSPKKNTWAQIDCGGFTVRSEDLSISLCCSHFSDTERKRRVMSYFICCWKGGTGGSTQFSILNWQQQSNFMICFIRLLFDSFNVSQAPYHNAMWMLWSNCSTKTAVWKGWALGLNTGYLIITCIITNIQ